MKIWNLDPLEGFSCKSFFRNLIEPSPLGLSVFSMLWRTKIPRNVRCVNWQVLHGRATRWINLRGSFPRLWVLSDALSKGGGRHGPYYLVL